MIRVRFYTPHVNCVDRPQLWAHGACNKLLSNLHGSQSRANFRRKTRKTFSNYDIPHGGLKFNDRMSNSRSTLFSVLMFLFHVCSMILVSFNIKIESKFTWTSMVGHGDCYGEADILLRYSKHSLRLDRGFSAGGRY